jgi:hypothetical protein
LASLSQFNLKDIPNRCINESCSLTVIVENQTTGGKSVEKGRIAACIVHLLSNAFAAF